MTTLCYSADDERFENDIDCVIDTILSNALTVEDARVSLIYIGEKVPPTIKAEWLLEYVKEKTDECVWEQSGDFAEHFLPETDYDLALRTHLQQWIDKLIFNCYTVKNVRSESIMNYVTEKELEEFFS